MQVASRRFIAEQSEIEEKKKKQSNVGSGKIASQRKEDQKQIEFAATDRRKDTTDVIRQHIAELSCAFGDFDAVTTEIVIMLNRSHKKETIVPEIMEEIYEKISQLLNDHSVFFSNF